MIRLMAPSGAGSIIIMGYQNKQRSFLSSMAQNSTGTLPARLLKPQGSPGVALPGFARGFRVLGGGVGEARGRREHAMTSQDAPSPACVMRNCRVGVTSELNEEEMSRDKDRLLSHLSLGLRHSGGRRLSTLRTDSYFAFLGKDVVAGGPPGVAPSLLGRKTLGKQGGYGSECL